MKKHIWFVFTSTFLILQHSFPQSIHNIVKQRDAEIIDNVTGSYRKYLQAKIFDKVGMHNTYLVDQSTVHPFEVRGYTLLEGKLVNIRRVRDFEIPSHFGIFSNVDDLRKWDSVLNTNSLFTDESKRLMWGTAMLNNGETTGYGLDGTQKKCMVKR